MKCTLRHCSRDAWEFSDCGLCQEHQLVEDQAEFDRELDSIRYEGVDA